MTWSPLGAEHLLVQQYLLAAGVARRADALTTVAGPPTSRLLMSAMFPESANFEELWFDRPTVAQRS